MADSNCLSAKLPPPTLQTHNVQTPEPEASYCVVCRMKNVCWHRDLLLHRTRPQNHRLAWRRCFEPLRDGHCCARVECSRESLRGCGASICCGHCCDCDSRRAGTNAGCTLWSLRRVAEFAAVDPALGWLLERHNRGAYGAAPKTSASMPALSPRTGFQSAVRLGRFASRIWPRAATSGASGSPAPAPAPGLARVCNFSANEIKDDA